MRVSALTPVSAHLNAPNSDTLTLRAVPHYPFSEAQFKTLKYQPDFADRFGAYEGAETLCQRFFPGTTPSTATAPLA